jgi:hypothetical protein
LHAQAEALFQPELVAPLSRMDLPAILARGCAGDAIRLEQHDVCAGLGEMERGG